MTSFAGPPVGTGTVLASPAPSAAQTSAFDGASRGLDFSSASPSGFWDSTTNTRAGSGLTTMGMAAQLTGSFMSAIGGYFAAQSQKDVLKSQALSAEFQASMANINARQAEVDAQAILAAGRQQVGQLTAQRGQERAKQKVSAASRGVVGNVGSAAEILNSQDIVKEIDAMTINRNAVRAAGQARMQSTNARNQSLLAGVSAGNLRRTAGTISPSAAFHANSLAGAGRFAASFSRSR